jgi:hypothetical protein
MIEASEISTASRCQARASSDNPVRRPSRNRISTTITSTAAWPPFTIRVPFSGCTSIAMVRPHCQPAPAPNAAASAIQPHSGAVRIRIAWVCGWGMNSTRAQAATITAGRIQSRFSFKGWPRDSLRIRR